LGSVQELEQECKPNETGHYFGAMPKTLGMERRTDVAKPEKLKELAKQAELLGSDLETNIVIPTAARGVLHSAGRVHAVSGLVEQHLEYGFRW